MLIRLQRYNYELVYLSSSQMVLADTLSRAYLPTAGESTSFNEELAAALSTVDADQMSDLRMIASPETIAKVTAAVKGDDEYGCLMKQIARGWPSTADEVPPCIRPYHTFADELSVSCGLVFKGHRIVVPLSMRPYFLDRLHSAHTGVNACLRRAKETVYWPSITTDIKHLVEACSICVSFEQSTQKEPLMSHSTPSRVWEKVGVDVFMFGDREYLITVDYLSGFFEIDRLPSKSVSDIVYCLKQHFARHGLPVELVSDNSPFNSSEFARFASTYEFRHVTSSPRYPQSNGRSENSVRTAKRIMTKAREAGTDPYLALLEWRNTPSESLKLSPAQLLFGRRTRTRLPTANKLLDTPTTPAASSALAAAKDQQAVYYNRGAKERQPLTVGQTVRVKYDDRSTEWRKAEVSKVLPHRSYEVNFDDGTTRRRTSRHVRFSAEPPIIFNDDELELQPSLTPLTPSATPSPVESANCQQRLPSQPIITTHSERQVVRPARYRD